MVGFQSVGERDPVKQGTVLHVSHASVGFSPGPTTTNRRLALASASRDLDRAHPRRRRRHGFTVGAKRLKVVCDRLGDHRRHLIDRGTYSGTSRKVRNVRRQVVPCIFDHYCIFGLAASVEVPPAAGDFRRGGRGSGLHAPVPGSSPVPHRSRVPRRYFRSALLSQAVSLIWSTEVMVVNLATSAMTSAVPGLASASPMASNESNFMWTAAT